MAACLCNNQNSNNSFLSASARAAVPQAWLICLSVSDICCLLIIPEHMPRGCLQHTAQEGHCPMGATQNACGACKIRRGAFLVGQSVSSTPENWRCLDILGWLQNGCEAVASSKLDLYVCGRLATEWLWDSCKMAKNCVTTMLAFHLPRLSHRSSSTAGSPYCHERFCLDCDSSHWHRQENKSPGYANGHWLPEHHV